MPITITATFVADNLSELGELMSLIGDNEPTDVQVIGCLHWGDHDDDQTPPFGIDRTEAFAKAAEAAQWREREHATGYLFDELVHAASEYREHGLSQDDYLASVDYLAQRVDSPQAMPSPPMPTTVLSFMRDLRPHIGGDHPWSTPASPQEFQGVVHELGRDAWGSTTPESVL